MENTFSKTVSLSSANTNYNLYSLMKAAQDFEPWCSCLQLQVDMGAGAAIVRVGDKDLSDTNYGFELVAGQAFPIGDLQTNSIPLPNFFLRSTVALTAVAVFALVKTEKEVADLLQENQQELASLLKEAREILTRIDANNVGRRMGATLQPR
jgi:hypothetical protein